MKWLRTLPLFAVCAMLVRCSSFGSDADSTAPDAAGTSDAASDTTGDGPSPVDAGCDHLFCEDFDDDAGFARWSATRVDNGPVQIQYGIDSDASQTPPRSFWVSSTALTYDSVARLAVKLPTTSTVGVTCDVAVRFDHDLKDGIATVAEFGIVAPSPAPAYAATFELRKGGLTFIQEDTIDGGTPENAGPPLGFGAWHVLTLTLRRASATLEVAVDGLDRTSAPLPNLPRTIDAYVFEIGIVDANPFATGDVAFGGRWDAVRCDAL